MSRLSGPLQQAIDTIDGAAMLALLAAACTAAIGWGLVWAAHEQTEPLSYQLRLQKNTF